MNRLHLTSVRLLQLMLASGLIAISTTASAAVWQWGCIGAMGDDQVVFNRYRLVLVSGKAPVGKLDDIIAREDPVFPEVGSRVLASYQPDDINGGFEKQMSFSSDTPKSKLVLTELSSKKIGRKARLVASCRDESTDRFRRVYRLGRDAAPALNVTLTCVEYQLSTRGGRTCR